VGWLTFETLLRSYSFADPFPRGPSKRKLLILIYSIAVGSGILEFRNNYSFGVHLVYALLSGRPVIIMAEARNEK
jgi:hypothetical protein